MKSDIQDGVSVIIPVYNYDRYLGEAIESALIQEYPIKEVVVIDDGSTDQSADVCKNFSGKIRYIYQKNTGLSAARNTGVRSSKYPYVLFLDADDILLQGLIKHSMKIIRSVPNVVLVASKGHYILNDGSRRDPNDERFNIPGEVFTRDIILKTRFPPSGVVVKKQVFERVGYFDTTLRSSEDRDMWIRVSSCGRVFLHENDYVGLRKHDSNMSRNADRMKINIKKTIKKAFLNAAVPRSYIFYWLQVFSYFYCQVSLPYWAERRRVAALANLGLSFILWPFFIRPVKLGKPMFFRLGYLVRILVNYNKY